MRNVRWRRGEERKRERRRGSAGEVASGADVLLEVPGPTDAASGTEEIRLGSTCERADRDSKAASFPLKRFFSPS